MSCAIRSGWVARRATLEGDEAAFSRMARARRPEGGEEARASVKEGGGAMVRRVVKLRGARSFVAREAAGVGSWGVRVRVAVRPGRRRLRRGGVLVAVAC
jgi:hypothetical protein